MSNTINTATLSTKRAPYCAPRNKVEHSLAVIWSETLKLDVATIGTNDSFLDLGGAHSLVIIQLIAMIADAFGVEIPIADILAQPTISQLAALIENMRGEQAASA